MSSRASIAGDDAPAAGTLVRLVGSLLGDIEAPAEATSDVTSATHKQGKSIKIQGSQSGHQLQTFCLNRDGLIFALVGPPRSYGNEELKGKKNTSEIQVFDAEGKELRTWDVDFAAQSISVAPNGTVYVAGNGRIARYDTEGKLLLAADVPHIARLLKDSTKLQEEAQARLDADKEEATEQIKELEDGYAEQQKEIDQQKDRLNAKPEGERTPAEKRAIKNLETALKNAKVQNKATINYYKQRSERSLDEVTKELTGRLRVINALAVSDTDVFIASGVTKGYGYAIWRTTPDFEAAEQIVTGLSGCCGQMDIRCCDDGVYVAENSRKRVLHFDREGKKLAQWGEGDRTGAGDKFGGCCNPMNLCFGAGGDVYTAESEGFIKRFTKEGSFLGIVGQAKVSGGCKNVAIGVSPDAKKAYFFDLQGSRIVVLNEKSDGKDEASDEKPKKSRKVKTSTAAE